MEPESTPHWSPATRVGFRLACAYLGIYFLQAALELVPFWTQPAAWYTQKLHQLVPWVGARVLELEKPITVFPLGSGDTTYNYVELLCFAAFALVVGLVWSVLARKADHHARTHATLHTGLRFLVGMALLSYGMAKVIKTQFPFPRPERLLQPYGDSSPMGLLWTFIGASAPYNLFTGLCEAIPGVLLFYRRTATLGALIGAAVMANIAALNFCYDVPVKLYSLHLLAGCLFLALPDAGRLWNVLVAKRLTVPAPRTQWRWRWAELARPWLATAYLGYLLYGQIPQGLEMYRTFSDGMPRGPLYGVYEVLAFEHDGVALEPTDPRAWKQVVFYRGNDCTVTFQGGRQASLRYEAAASGETVQLQAGRDAEADELETVWNDPEHLDLAGDFGGALVVAQMKRRRFLLEERGFHWVNETPFNR